MRESARERRALDAVLVPTIRLVQPLRVRLRFQLRLSDGCVMIVSLNGLERQSQLCNLPLAASNYLTVTEYFQITSALSANRSRSN